MSQTPTKREECLTLAKDVMLVLRTLGRKVSQVGSIAEASTLYSTLTDVASVWSNHNTQATPPILPLANSIMLYCLWACCLQSKRAVVVKALV
jgi:hypothetical protein